MAVVFVLSPTSEIEAAGVVDTVPDSEGSVPVGLGVVDPGFGVGREVVNPIAAVDGPTTAPIKVNTADSVLQHLNFSLSLSQQYSA
jgi:hypothetical protein